MLSKHFSLLKTFSNSKGENNEFQISKKRIYFINQDSNGIKSFKSDVGGDRDSRDTTYHGDTTIDTTRDTTYHEDTSTDHGDNIVSKVIHSDTHDSDTHDSDIHDSDIQDMCTLDEDSIISTLTLHYESDSDDTLILALSSPSTIIQIYSTLPNPKLLKSIKSGHEAPILCMDTHISQKLLATGSADSIVKVWNWEKGFQTHNLKGHSGIISCLVFDSTSYTLASASDDCSIRVWDLAKKACVAVLDSHVSVLRELCFTPDHLYSAGRDSVFMKWSRKDNYSAVLTVPVYESIESLQLIKDKDDNVMVCTAGESGALKLWDSETGDLISTYDRPEGATYNFSKTIFKNKTLHALTSDQTLLQLQVDEDSSLQLTNSLSTYNDDILQVLLINNNTQLLTATNSSLLKCYTMSTGSCQVIYGHSDTILSLAASPSSSHLLASGSKDSTIIIWSQSPDGKITKQFTLEGHTGHVTALAFVSPTTLLSASTDRTLKCWDLSTKKSTYTFIAHENDITSVKVSPSSTYLATSSLDKSCKVWRVSNGTLHSTLKHKRGIWGVDFSPIDQTLVTASSDKTLKVWTLDGTCLRTLEGHLNTVLDCSFLPSGLQILSTGADGLMKMWNMKGECETFDVHEDRVWSLSVGDGVVVTGSADCSIKVWRDDTKEIVQAEEEAESFLVAKTSDLRVFVERRDFKSALILALDLDMSVKCLEIFTQLSREPKGESVSGSKALDTYLTSLQHSPKMLMRLLGYIQTWTTSAKHTDVVQTILHHLLQTIPSHVWIELGPRGRDAVQALVVYSQRHLERVGGMMREMYLVDHLLDRMDAII